MFFNNILNYITKKVDNCDIIIGSDHNPVINIIDDIKCMTLNTQHCYLKYKECSKKKM